MYLLDGRNILEIIKMEKIDNSAVAAHVWAYKHKINLKQKIATKNNKQFGTYSLGKYFHFMKSKSFV